MRKLIKILYSPITLLVYVALTIMTSIVFITEYIIRVLWFILKPVRVVLNIVGRLIKKKIDHYKYKDSWKDYYNE